MFDCIEWPYGKTGAGYGYCWVGGKSHYVHRFVFSLYHGFYPEVVRHKCDNPACYNIEHLEGGTVQDNVRDSIERGRWNRARKEKHYLSRLSVEDVDSIRRRKKEGERALDLALEYGYSLRGIYNILSKTNWN